MDVTATGIAWVITAHPDPQSWLLLGVHGSRVAALRKAAQHMADYPVYIHSRDLATGDTPAAVQAANPTGHSARQVTVAMLLEAGVDACP